MLILDLMKLQTRYGLLKKKKKHWPAFRPFCTLPYALEQNCKKTIKLLFLTAEISRWYISVKNESARAKKSLFIVKNVYLLPVIQRDILCILMQIIFLTKQNKRKISLEKSLFFNIINNHIIKINQ